jgi:hypothetical protein
LDKDPFTSKLRVLTHRFKKEQRELDLQADREELWEAMARADEERIREAEAQAA